MKKLRTRQHIIEDLGFNHVERQVLLAGYVFRKYHRDYGIDGEIQFFSEIGEVENQYIVCQLKSTDRLKFQTEKTAWAFDLSLRDLEFWLEESRLVLLILYDAQSNCSYFLDLQDYFSKKSEVLRQVNKFVRISIPTENLLLPEVFQQYRLMLNSK